MKSLSNYRTLLTQRGFIYSYYFYFPTPTAVPKPVLFFAHGFPSSSYLWRRQIEFFRAKGFGLVVPDMLGYGGTDKPTDPTAYIGSGLAQDVVDILDKEGIKKVVAIAHDWGTRVVSRLINHHPDRVSACAFLGSGYGPPNSRAADPISQSRAIKEAVGYDLVAYMRFFIEEDSAKLIEGDGEKDHIDSFINLLYPATPDVWMDNMCADGSARAWIEQDRKTSLPSYMTQKDFQYYRKQLKDGGLAAPLCWYKVLVTEESHNDDASVSAVNCKVKQPLLFIAFTGDCISLPAFGDAVHNDADNVLTDMVTRAEVQGDHWAVESHGGEINNLILNWIGSL
ncbi:alpha/beta-hydrolase [Mycena galericulata]|nr:alpha/beta-hydrolase [Mycena galericulata]